MLTNIHFDDVAGVVVLYNSPIETLYNINTYIYQVKKLYVVDNSIQTNSVLVSSLMTYKHVEYHLLNKNEGIAAALNWAANRAIEDGFAVLLTMDDDTTTPHKMIKDMLFFWNNYQKPIGLLSGIHHHKKESVNYRSILFTLTSGNLINLIAYQKIGGFCNELFIDHVDHDYGIRLNANGYQVIELTDIILGHKLGYTQSIRVGNISFGKYGTHPPARQYYFARNGVYLSRIYYKNYPNFVYMVTKELFKRCVKAIFLDSNKHERISMLLIGLKHGWQGKLGKF